MSNLAVEPIRSSRQPQTGVGVESMDQEAIPKSLLEIRGGQLNRDKVDAMICALELSKQCLLSCIENTGENVVDQIDFFFSSREATIQIENGQQATTQPIDYDEPNKEQVITSIVKNRLLRRCGEAIGESCIRQQLTRDKKIYNELILKRCFAEKKKVA